MVRSWFSDKVEKRLSEIEGKGLFALTDIAKGELLVVKGGHLFDRNKRDQLSLTLGPSEIQIEDDLFIGPVTPEEREGSMMHLNHSCEPNVGIRGQICFHAMRDIARGEELTFDYATGDADDWQMKCACGSFLCRGTVTGKDWQITGL
ncbi:SET domain-containing protein-lysine N-methyltransferase [Roseibium sp. SCPC15]|uniref:SET domain-containing protein n=1 Tax=Roseibium sp. SCP15 TaxID=3141376 RepID=UPI00333DB48C